MFGGSSSPFGQQPNGQSATPGQNNQFQQQQARPGFSSPLNVNDLQQRTQQQQQQQQGQPQQGQQGTPFGQSGSGQQSSFGQPSQPQSGFGFGQSQPQPMQQQQQSQPWGNSQFSGPSGVNTQSFGQGPQQNQHQSYMMQQQQQQPQNQFQNQPFAQQQAYLQNNNVQQGSQQAQNQQQVYLPGYLSKIRGQRPYSPSLSRKASEAPVSDQASDEGGVGVGGSGAGANAHGTSSFATPNSRSSREGNRRSSLEGGPSSPLQGFSSSFFSSPTSDPPTTSSHRAFDGSSSIFGARGLRGAGSSNNRSVYGRGGREGSSAATPGRDRSSSYMRSSSIGSPSATGGLGASSGAGNVGDDDDAPPAETLAEADSGRNEYGPSTSFGDSGNNLMAISPPSAQSTAGARGGISPGAGQHAPSSSSSLKQDRGGEGSNPSLCTLLVYGFPSSLNSTVLNHFGNIGEIVSHSSLAPAGDASSSSGQILSECLRIMYAEPWHALRALRRNGELVAGVAYVGVRWADESLHQEMLINGISSSSFQGGSANGTGSHVAVAAPATSQVVEGGHRSNTPSNTSNGGLMGAGAGARSARDSTPSFGRPINFVDSPAAALRARASNGPGGAGGSGTSSPFRAIGGLFGGGAGAGGPSGNNSATGTPSRTTGAAGGGGGSSGGGANTGLGTPGNQSGVMGRIGDAIFGW